MSSKFLWYEARAETKQWWHVCSGRNSLLAMGADAGQWVHRKDGTTLWEDGNLDEKLESIGLEEDSYLAENK